MTRLLVLFVVYGVGDRNMLEPVIRDLYVRLLQSRNREKPEYSTLWSEKEIEIFSTQRAVQALTFYYAYARGKELVSSGLVGKSQDALQGTIVLVNKTGRPLFLEARGEEQRTATIRDTPHFNSAVTPPPLFTAKTFGEYLQERKRKLVTQLNDEGIAFVTKVKELGDAIIGDIGNKTCKDVQAARLILNALVGLVDERPGNERLREPEFRLLEEQYADLNEMGQGQQADARSDGLQLAFRAKASGPV
jgi:hypothetical protein